jgi:hypothetical protein
MYDRGEKYLVLTQMGSANATAKMFAVEKIDGDGEVWFTIPSYMCGFFFNKTELYEHQRTNKFLVNITDSAFRDAQWKMEYCNGYQFSENRIIPLQSWGRLMVNHLTNRYAPDGERRIRVKARDYLFQMGYKYDGSSDTFKPLNNSNPKLNISDPKLGS